MSLLKAKNKKADYIMKPAFFNEVNQNFKI